MLRVVELHVPLIKRLIYSVICMLSAVDQILYFVFN